MSLNICTSTPDLSACDILFVTRDPLGPRTMFDGGVLMWMWKVPR